MNRLLTLLLVASVLGCGDDDPTDPSEPFEQTITGDVSADGMESHLLTAPRGGTLEAVLRWESDEIDLDLYLTAATCSDPYECPVLDESTAFTGTAETVRESVSSGQQLELWVESWSDVASGYTIEVTID